jgi:hypothetical protein
MLIAVMSDSHDHIWNLQKALELIRKEGVQQIVHCGDFIAPFMIQELDKAGIPVHGVFGNNDGDQYLLTQLSLTSLNHITLHGLVGEIEISGYRIGFTHQNLLGEGLAALKKYDLVCFGHTHQAFQSRTGNTVLLNPGEIMGKDGLSEFCIVDTMSGDIKRVTVTD